MNKYLSSCYHLLWYSVAVLLILAAVMVTAVRLALPGIGSYKDQIQAWVSGYMQYPVVINEISADWTGWSPNLHLRNIDLYDQENNRRIARFDYASLGIDLVSSLWRGEIIPQHLSITGLNLDLIRNNDGSISLRNQTMPSNTGNSGNPELAQWLLSQRYIILDEATVDWTDNKSGKPAKHFENVRLAIKTDGERRQLDASVTLPASYGKGLTIKIDMQGNPLQTDWDGEIYIETSQLLASRLLEMTPVKAERGFADVKVWTRWQDTRLLEINADARLEGVVMVAEGYQTSFNTAEVMLNASRHNDKDWLLNIGLEDVKTAHGLWPASTHELLLSSTAGREGYHLDGKFSFLRLQDVLPLLINSDIVAVKDIRGIDPASVVGDLSNVEVSGFTDAAPASIYFRAELDKLAFSHPDSQFSVDNLSGQVELHDEFVRLDLNSEETEIRLGQFYVNSKQLQKLEGSLQFNRTNNPSIEIMALSFTTENMPVELSGNIRLDDDSPYIDLIGRIGESEIENLPAFLPLQTHSRFMTWAPNALLGGQLTSGDLVFRGKANAFPFRDDQGTFKALLNIADATINYEEGWPYVDKLTAEVIMDNDDISITASSGYVFDAHIDRVSAHIHDISRGEQHITIDGDLSGHTSNLPLFIMQSPLKENPDLYDFAQMHIAGNFELGIKLDVPLGDGLTAVNGSIRFTNTMFESNMPGLGLTNMNGEIKFSRDAAWGENISALYHGNPVSITIPFDDEDDGRSTFVVNGEADKVFIIQQLGSFFPELLNQKHSFFDYFQGGSNWSVSIESYRDESDQQYRDILIESPLRGIEIMLPEPVGKNATATRSLMVKANMAGSRINKIDFEYDDQVFTNMYVDNSEDFKINRIEVDLGKDYAPDTALNADIVIRGELQELDLGDWFEFFNNESTARTPANDTDKRTLNMELDVDNLRLLDQSYVDTRITVSNGQPAWLVGFHGEDIRGQARYTESTPTAADNLVMRLDHLKIIKQEKSGTGKDELDVNMIPELDIEIEDFVFHGKHLGKTRLLTSNQKNSMTIESLTFNKPEISINTTGIWQFTDGINQTDIKTDIKADTLAALMQTLTGETENIDKGETSMQLTLNWMDNPVNFEMDKVIGQLDVKVGKGQLIDLNPSAGRLLGLLSITTLPRRLSLDFSDLFREGFAFDRIEGNFNLQNGQAYTNDLHMSAPAADISISGRTGFVTEDYDQVATVMPKITSSLPVASALFGPVGIGIGTAIFLAGEVFESIPKQINKILSYQYSIQGSWENPDIKRIEKGTPSG